MDFHRVINRTLFWRIGAALLCAAALFMIVRRYRVPTEPPVVAIGLRGTSRVNKNLSDLQQRRLNDHFVAAPPLAHTRAPRQPHSDIEAINQFNQGQVR